MLLDVSIADTISAFSPTTCPHDATAKMKMYLSKIQTKAKALKTQNNALLVEILAGNFSSCYVQIVDQHLQKRTVSQKRNWRSNFRRSKTAMEFHHVCRVSLAVFQHGKQSCSKLFVLRNAHQQKTESGHDFRSPMPAKSYLWAKDHRRNHKCSSSYSLETWSCSSSKSLKSRSLPLEASSNTICVYKYLQNT